MTGVVFSPSRQMMSLVALLDGWMPPKRLHLLYWSWPNLALKRKAPASRHSSTCLGCTTRYLAWETRAKRPHCLCRKLARLCGMER